MADTPNGETVNPQAPSNEPSSTPAPVVDNSSDSAVEAAQKEAAQATLRANQLANENAKLKADQEAAARKQLEEKEEYKTLWEKEKAERENLLAEQQSATQRAEADTKSKEVFAQFSPDVVKVAEAAGMSLSDTSPDAISQFESKLKTIAETVKTPGVTGNNPVPETPRQPGDPDPELVKAMRYGNKDARRKYIQESPSIQAAKKTLQEQVGVYGPNL